MADDDIKGFISVPLDKFSGFDFQQDLGLRWQPLYLNNGFEDLKYDMSIYWEEYDKSATSKDKKLLGFLKKVLDKKGYFVHIVGEKRDYIGFRKLDWSEPSDIYSDILENFEEQVEDD